MRRKVGRKTATRKKGASKRLFGAKSSGRAPARLSARKSLPTKGFNLSLLRGAVPIPTCAFCDHTYCSSGAYPGTQISTGTSGNFGTAQKYHLTSMYAPQVGGGHQPYARDQFAALYGKYIVVGVEYEINFVPSATSAKYAVCALVQGPDGGLDLSAAAVNSVRELPGAAIKIMPDVSVSPCTIKGRFNPWTIFGLSESEYLDNADVYGAESGADPTKMVELAIAVGDLLGSSGKLCAALVTLRMKTKWYDPINLGTS